jgi:hypothetical protein
MVEAAGDVVLVVVLLLNSLLLLKFDTSQVLLFEIHLPLLDELFFALLFLSLNSLLALRLTISFKHVYFDLLIMLFERLF